MKKKNVEPLTSEAGFSLMPIIKRRLPLLMLGGLLGVAGATAYYLLMPPKYESRTEIMVMQSDAASMASLDKSASQTDVSEELLATHMKIVQSKKVINDALANHGLLELPSLLDQLGETGGVVDYVRDNLYVTSGGSGAAKEAHVLNISFVHTSPEDAQTVSAALIEEYEKYVKAKFQDINSKAVELIDKARIELEEEIAELDQEYSEFRMNTPLLTGSTAGGDIHTLRYEELANQASMLTSEIDESEGRLSLVKESLALISKSDNNFHGLDKLALIDERNATRLGILVSVERGQAESAAFQALQPERAAGAQTEYNSLLEKKSKLNQLRKDLGAQHPDVRMLQNQVSEMEDFLRNRADQLSVTEEAQLTPDDIMDAYVHMLENDLAALRKRLEYTNDQMKIAEEEAKKLIDLQIENEDLARSRLRKEDLYGATVERIRTLNMQNDSSSLVLEKLEEPGLGEKVQPNIPVALAIFVLTSLVVGGGSTLLAEYRDRSVHEPEELEKIFNAAIIGHVPNFDRDQHASKAIRQAKRKKDLIDPYLLAHHAPGSRASEGFRAMRTQTVFALGGNHKVLCVTSGTEGAGKSTMVSNLAVSLGSSGKSVLLIDCDLRRPRQAKIFGIENDKGLVDVVSGDLAPSDVVQEVTSGLSLMPSGRLPDNPAEILASVGFKNLIEGLREKYDYIMLDCPPVLPVADPTILAPMADGVLVVATIGHESKPQSERTSRVLASVGAKVIGVIVNRVDEASTRYGYNAYGYESTKQNPYYNTAGS